MPVTYVLLAVLASAQSSARDSLMAEGIRLAPMQPAAALARFETVLAADSADVAANWRAGIALNDVAQPLRTRAERDRRGAPFHPAGRFPPPAGRPAPGGPPAPLSPPPGRGHPAPPPAPPGRDPHRTPSPGRP